MPDISDQYRAVGESVVFRFYINQSLFHLGINTAHSATEWR